LEEAIRRESVPNFDPSLIHMESAELGGVLDVEASHLALAKTENVSDRLVFQPVRLPLKRFAFEIADGLPDLCDGRETLQQSSKRGPRSRSPISETEVTQKETGLG
jgi:hypothetical protein